MAVDGLLSGEHCVTDEELLSCLPNRYRIGNSSTKIMDGLFLGNAEAASDIDFLSSIKCQKIINCAANSIPNLFSRLGISYLTFHWIDNPRCVAFDPSGKSVRKIFRFIESALSRGQSVLVHSVHGRSRSSLVVAAYLMMRFQWPLHKCLEFIKFRRPDGCRPKPYFEKQLRNLQTSMRIEDQPGPSRWLATTPRDEMEEVVRNTFLNSHRIMPPEAEVLEKPDHQTLSPATDRTAGADAASDPDHNRSAGASREIESEEAPKKPLPKRKKKKRVTWGEPQIFNEPGLVAGSGHQGPSGPIQRIDTPIPQNVGKPIYPDSFEQYELAQQQQLAAAMQQQLSMHYNPQRTASPYTDPYDSSSLVYGNSRPKSPARQFLGYDRNGRANNGPAPFPYRNVRSSTARSKKQRPPRMVNTWMTPRTGRPSSGGKKVKSRKRTPDRTRAPVRSASEVNYWTSNAQAMRPGYGLKVVGNELMGGSRLSSASSSRDFPSREADRGREMPVLRGRRRRTGSSGKSRRRKQKRQPKRPVSRGSGIVRIKPNNAQLLKRSSSWTSLGVKHSRSQRTLPLSQPPPLWV